MSQPSPPMDSPRRHTLSRSTRRITQLRVVCRREFIESIAGLLRKEPNLIRQNDPRDSHVKKKRTLVLQCNMHPAYPRQSPARLLLWSVFSCALLDKLQPNKESFPEGRASKFQKSVVSLRWIRCSAQQNPAPTGGIIPSLSRGVMQILMML